MSPQVCVFYWMSLQVAEKHWDLFFSVAPPSQYQLFHDTCKIYDMKMLKFDRIMKAHHQGNF